MVLLQAVLIDCLDIMRQFLKWCFHLPFSLPVCFSYFCSKDLSRVKYGHVEKSLQAPHFYRVKLKLLSPRPYHSFHPCCAPQLLMIELQLTPCSSSVCSWNSSCTCLLMPLFLSGMLSAPHSHLIWTLLSSWQIPFHLSRLKNIDGIMINVRMWNRIESS